MPFDNTCIIPRVGRTFENILSHFYIKTKNEDLLTIIKLLKESKANSNADFATVIRYIEKLNEEIPCFNIAVDRKRVKRPYRVGFCGYDLKILDNNVLRLEGDESHNCSSLIKIGEADMAIVGFDEVLTLTQNDLSSPVSVTKWGQYNYHIRNDDFMKIAGSAFLTRYNEEIDKAVLDIAAFFLISKKDKVTVNSNDFEYPHEYLKFLSKNKQPIYVKRRYTGIVSSAYPGLLIEPVDDVEDSITQKESGALGIEIVQSGSTIINKDLVIHGAPFFISESVYLVDYNKYSAKESLRDLLEILNPIGFFDHERIKHYVLWYISLEKKLGKRWLNKPKIDDLFINDREIDNGLRPYRLATRYWKADDNYKINAAIEEVRNSKKIIISEYNKSMEGI